MRLGSQEGLRQPSAVKNLTDVPKFKEFSNSLFDERKLTRPRSGVLTGIRPCASCVNLILMILTGTVTPLLEKMRQYSLMRSSKVVR